MQVVKQQANNLIVKLCYDRATFFGEIYTRQRQVVRRPDVLDESLVAAPHDDRFAEHKAAQLNRSNRHDHVVVAHHIFVICRCRNSKYEKKISMFW